MERVVITDVVMWPRAAAEVIQWLQLQSIKRDLPLKIFPVLQLGATENLQPHSRIIHPIQLKLVG